MASAMTAVLRDAAAHLARVPAPVSVVGREVLADLDAPVRVGVVGRVSSGKSTLVNALLGVPIAPVGAGETTFLPCRFEHGRYTTASAVIGNRRVSLALTGDHLPDRLPPEAGDWSAERGVGIEVTLASPLLEHLQLLDTPGLASTSTDVSARTAALLEQVTGDCVRQVDALLLVLTGSTRAEDAEAARTLISSVPAVAGVPVVAVLTRCDTFHQDLPTAMRTATAVAQGIAADNHQVLSQVIPLVGLLASTGVTGALTERHIRNLRVLVDELAEDQELVLCDARLLAEIDSALSLAERAELVKLLGLSGLSWTLNHLRAYPATDARMLCDALEQVSGISPLVRVLREVLLSQTEYIKASTALARLEQAGRDPSVPPPLAAHIRELPGMPQLVGLQLQRALHLLSSSRVPVPPELAEELRAARQYGVAGLQRDHPAAAAARWRAWQMVADGPGRSGAATMIRVHQARSMGYGR